LEAIRQIGNEEGRGNAIFVHVTLVPYIAAAGELKTKPTQHSVRNCEKSVFPPTFFCAARKNLCRIDLRRKIALFCNVQENAVISALWT
jgi:CTP synthase